MADALRVREHAVFDPKAGAQPLCVFDSLGAVRRDPFVDRNSDELDVPTVSEELREERRRGARVLPAAHPDRDPVSAAEIDLRTELALRAPLDELEEVILAQVLPTVPEPLYRGGAAPVARHGRSTRRGGVRAHGPGVRTTAGPGE